MSNAIKIPLEDIAASLRMPEMPSASLLEDRTVKIYSRYSGLPPDKLEILCLQDRERMFAQHEIAVETRLRETIKGYGIKATLEGRSFSFLPEKTWAHAAAKILRTPKVYHGGDWKAFIEKRLRENLKFSS